MGTAYKIHPGIGIARVGRSTKGYFLQGERAGAPPFEISPTGEEAPFTGYKDDTFLIRREAVRFRVYRYETDDTTGRMTLIGEVLPSDAKVIWRVTLANSKSAGPAMVTGDGPGGSRVIIPKWGELRNDLPSGVDRDTLVARTSYEVSGSKVTAPRKTGRIGLDEVFIGEARTDDAGRLIVLGGLGFAGTFDHVAHELPDFLNNPGWYDDVADGPVDADLLFPDGTRVSVQHGAWVVVAPPDFVPNTAPVLNLFDVLEDDFFRDGRLNLPSTISYVDDIRPILQKMADLEDVNDMRVWGEAKSLLANESRLADPTPAGAAARQHAMIVMLKPERPGGLMDFRYTSYVKAKLERWRAGQFIPGRDASRPALTEPEELDQATLRRAVGGGFFPGIEAGFMFTLPSLFSELGRFSRGPFQDHDGKMRALVPGSVTQRMAVPWQADFTECEGRWWPSQRPDLARFGPFGEPYPGTPAPGQSGYYWHRGVVVGSVGDQLGDPKQHLSHFNMVERFAQLGVLGATIVDGRRVIAELGRHPSLDATV